MFLLPVSALPCLRAADSSASNTGQKATSCQQLPDTQIPQSQPAMGDDHACHAPSSEAAGHQRG